MYLADNNLADGVGTDWDVIVVGAGALGLVTAVSLARAGLRVLLLETGSTDPGAAQDLNEVAMTGRPHLGALHGRARVVGGTTTLWGGQLTQFIPYDFEARSIMSDAAWPISFADVARYYGDVASLLGLDLAHLSDCESPVPAGRRGRIRLRILPHSMAARIQSGPLVRG